jgi:hypothetical protein
VNTDSLKEKDPAETLDFGVDWTKEEDGSPGWLAGDTVSSFSAIVPVGITLAAEFFTGGRHIFWLSGGTVPDLYRITSQIVTVAGRTAQKSVYIQMVDK